MWWNVIIMVVAVAIGYLTRTRPETPRPATLDDFDMPVAEEGTAQEVIFGDCWTGSWMVLSYGNLRTQKIKTKSGK